MEKLAKRDYYLNRLVHSIGSGDVKVITGIRGSGKSVLLFDLFYQYLINQGVQDKNIIQIKLDQRHFFKYRNPATLCDYVKSVVKDKYEKYYLFIDEVQLTQTIVDNEFGGVEVTVYDMLNELNDYKNLDVFVTGSNSRGLSSDLPTQLRGRTTQIHMFPLSFKEYYSFYGGDPNKALDNYMLYGGMPRLLALSNERDKKNYLANLYEELYIKDIIERNEIKKTDLLNDILDYLASHIGSLTNPTKIANTITSLNNETINSKTVTNYLQHLADSFLVSKAKRFDIKDKKYYNYPNKYYFSDIGLQNFILNYRQFDPDSIIENIIYNELLLRGYSVDVGVVTDRTQNQNKQKEINFVVNDADRKAYIQSTSRIDPEENKNSILFPLTLTGDFFKKIVIRTGIPHSFYDHKGIFHCTLIDFLLDKVNLF